MQVLRQSMTSAKVKIDIKIMAVLKRKDNALRLAESTSLSNRDIIFDDRGVAGGGDAWYNAKRCWLFPLEAGTTHRLVLQDDIIVCNDFTDYVLKAVEQHPKAIWSFYNGGWIKNEFKTKNTPYCKINGCRTGAQALLIPVEHIQKMIDFTDNFLGSDYKHDDQRVGFYSLCNGINVMCCIPSLSDHIGFDSCIPHHNNKSRVSRTFNKDIKGENWDSKEINSTPFMTNNFWLPKNFSRTDLIKDMIKNASEKIKKQKT